MIKNLTVIQQKISKSLKKSYNGKNNASFPNNKVLKEDSQYICLLAILIDSVFITGKNYYPQVLFLSNNFLNYYTQIVIPKYIIDLLTIRVHTEILLNFSRIL